MKMLSFGNNSLLDERNPTKYYECDPMFVIYVAS